MLWLALHLPRLSLEALAATLPEAERARPLVLLDAHRLAAVDDAAAARGLRLGMKRATALALAPELLPGQADPARDAAALRAVAHAALAFTPLVSLHGPDTVLMEVQPSLRLFGGLAALQARLLAALSPLGHALCLAAAPTPLGAALLARWQVLEPAAWAEADLALHPVHGPHARDRRALARRLAAAPLALLDAAATHAEAWQALGLQRWAELLALPRDGLARRFGPALLDEIDRALGRRPDLRQPLAVPPVFTAALELPSRADRSDQVLAGAATLLAQLCAWARARQVRLRAFTLQMRHEPRHRGAAPAATELRIELATPALDIAHLQGLLRERLGRCVLAAPTLALRLQCDETAAAPAPNGELFPTRQASDDGLLRLVERLVARLGEAGVHGLQAVADHRPEHASRAVPAQALLAAPREARPGPAVPAVGQAAGQAAALTDSAALPLVRPAWLLPEPQPLATRDGLPLLQGRPLQLLAGPERIETGWWDDDPVLRDYHIAATAEGALVWVWRHRLADADGAARWFLHGRFA